MSQNAKKTDQDLAYEVSLKIDGFSEPNLEMAKRLHEIITSANSSLRPRLWYGMPGYALSKSTPVLIFFREDKYMTFGLTESLTLAPKSGELSKLIPCAWFFTDLDNETEKSIYSIVRDLDLK